jgi:glycosyltransferase involved in cell wall biosynthesis
MNRPFPFFSICIPNYNYAQYIGITIQSVLDQSWPHFEIIVADNASTDNSIEVVRAFNDVRIRLIQNPTNVGFAHNLDRATETAAGDYFILVSSDDTLKPGALETYAQLLSTQPQSSQQLVLSASIDIINSTGEVTGEKSAIAPETLNTLARIGCSPVEESKETIVFQGFDLLKAVLQGSMTNIGTFVSTCYPRSLYERVGGYRSTMSVIPDAQFSQKLMFQNPKVIFVKKPLFQYRVHSQNFYSQIFSHIRLYCDKYLLTQTYNDQDLAPLGLTRNRLVRNFVRHWCAEKAAWHMTQGKPLIAFRAWAFGWAASPRCMARNFWAWLFPVILLFSPLTIFAWKVRLILKK